MAQRLAQHLMAKGLVSAKLVDEALKRAESARMSLDTVLLQLGAIAEAGVLQAISDVSGVRLVNLADFEPNLEAAPLMPFKMSKQLGVVPLSVDGQTLHIACQYPVPTAQLKDVGFLLGRKLELWVALEARVRDWQSVLYGQPLEPAYARLLKQLDPSRPAPAPPVPEAEDDNPLIGDDTESLSSEVVQRSLSGLNEEPVLLTKPRKKKPRIEVIDEPSVVVDAAVEVVVSEVLGEGVEPRTTQFDATAYSRFARGGDDSGPQVPLDEQDRTRVLDLKGYENFARRLSTPDAAGAPLVFPGGVLPPRTAPPPPTMPPVTPGGWVQPASPARPPPEKVKPAPEEKAPSQPGARAAPARTGAPRTIEAPQVSASGRVPKSGESTGKAASKPGLPRVEAAPEARPTPPEPAPLGATARDETDFSDVDAMLQAPMAPAPVVPPEPPPALPVPQPRALTRPAPSFTGAMAVAELRGGTEPSPAVTREAERVAPPRSTARPAVTAAEPAERTPPPPIIGLAEAWTVPDPGVALQWSKASLQSPVAATPDAPAASEWQRPADGAPPAPAWQQPREGASDDSSRAPAPEWQQPREGASDDSSQAPAPQRQQPRARAADDSSLAAAPQWPQSRARAADDSSQAAAPQWQQPRAGGAAAAGWPQSSAVEASAQAVYPQPPGLAPSSAMEWTLAQARASLKEATSDREGLMSVVLEYGRRAFDFVSAFAVMRGAAVGWDSRGDGDVYAVRQLAVPLDAASVFRTVALTRGSYVGPLPPDALTQHYLALLGRAPRTVFVWPIEVQSRLVAIVYGDCGSRPISQRRLSDFILFCQDLPSAFHDLIVFRKQNPRAPPAFAAPPQDLQQAAADAVSGGEAPQDTEWFNGLITLLTGPDPSERSMAMLEFLKTPEASARALSHAFPGPTGWSRLPVLDLPEPDELGPVPGALARLGHAGAVALAPLLDSSDSDARYLALLTAGSLRYPEVVDGVLRGLFDYEPDISSAARAAATAYELRQQFASNDPLRRSLAARALGVLHDREAIDGLINLTGSEDELCATSAAEALKEVTRANFGTNPRAWTAWWARARSQRRVEWLVEALASEDFDLRLAAIEELSRAFSETYGFQADGPAVERLTALEHWQNVIGSRPDLDV